MPSEGDRRAAAALQLAEKPTDFLSTVQVGVTLVGVLAGAYGGATIAAPLAVSLRGWPAVARYAEAVALALVVAGITYLTLIIGELVPKRLALLDPERVAGIDGAADEAAVAWPPCRSCGCSRARRRWCCACSAPARRLRRR